MAGFTIEQTALGASIAVTGDLTAPLVPALQASLKQELAKGAREVVFDLGAIEALDSSGIGLLIATSNSADQAAGPDPTGQSVAAHPAVAALACGSYRRLNASGRDA